MHAVAVTVTLNDIEAATSLLKSDVVPGVQQAPGFVAGYWTQKGSSGSSMIIFESEEAADAVAQKIPDMAPTEAVTLDSVEVREVVASA